MPARIFCKAGKLKGVEAEIELEATLGRGRDATVQLQAEMVSGEHARITYETNEECYVLEDLGSTNGTWLDGIRVRGRERLGHLHVITIAEEHDFIFQDLDLCARRHGVPAVPPVADTSAEEPPSEDTAIDDKPAVLPPSIPAPPLTDIRSEREKTRTDEVFVEMPDFLAEKADAESQSPTELTSIDKLPIEMPGFLARKAEELSPQQKATVKLPPIEEVLEEDVEVSDEQLDELMLEESGEARAFGLEVTPQEGDVERFELREGENVLGRGKDAALQIDSLEVSRRHALLTVSEGKVTLQDLGSSNHSYVEGEKIHDAVELKLGAKLKFGRIKARLVRWEEDES